ncbi:AlpA family phage regulatory protein [Salmonella enterica subsp. enterica]|nr:AlpA family phage regulatory protein [Salmonella enterica subsp. enterica serovar Newport]ECQ6554835.1 AlpA family phage regulatory protein [Salmonella enterica subsp. enterica serovar Newport]
MARYVTPLEQRDPDSYIRQSELLALRCPPVCRTTMWRMVKKGQFPRPEAITEHVMAWRVSDVLTWRGAEWRKPESPTGVKK